MKGLFKFLFITLMTIVGTLALWVLCVQTIFSKKGKEKIRDYKERFTNYIQKIRGL